MNSIRTTVMASCLDLLEKNLNDALSRVVEAKVALAGDQHNQAVGTLLGLDETLANSSALHSVIISTHRSQVRL